MHRANRSFDSVLKEITRILAITSFFFVFLLQVYSVTTGHFVDPDYPDSSMREDAQSSYFPIKEGYGSLLWY